MATDTAELRTAEEKKIDELRKKLEIDDAIDTPIASLRDRINASLRSIAEHLGIWADASPDRPAPTEDVLAEVRTAEHLILGIESLNHIEAGTFGPKKVDLAAVFIGETVDGRLVLQGEAEKLALDALSEKAGFILEDGSGLLSNDVGARIGGLEECYREAGPYMTVIEQIFDRGIEDVASAKLLWRCIRELVERLDGDIGNERRRLLAARANGEDQLARETEEVCEELEAKALFADRICKTVDQFWKGLTESEGAKA